MVVAGIIETEQELFLAIVGAMLAVRLLKQVVLDWVG
jgi:hypothetical protein